MVVVVEEHPESPGHSPLAPVPVAGLSGSGSLPFPLYLATGKDRFVLYQPEDRPFVADNEDRLCAEGVQRLYIHERDRQAYSRRIEHELDGILRDRRLERSERAGVLTGVAQAVCADIFRKAPQGEDVRRARRLMASTASLATRDTACMRTVVRLLDGRPALVEHSLAVSMLALALGQRVLGNDSGLLVQVGLAGMFHDIGRIGQPEDDADPAHASRGYQHLRSIGVSQEICLAVLHHHERHDGSGFPDALQGDRIPPMAQVIGLVDTFHQLYCTDHNLFGTLRALAEIYRDCFPPKLAKALVQIFKR